MSLPGVYAVKEDGELSTHNLEILIETAFRGPRPHSLNRRALRRCYRLQRGLDRSTKYVVLASWVA